MQYFFLRVKGENMFLTLTDLDNTVVKKNKFIKNYIYFFHGAVSTTKVYTQQHLIIMIQYYVMEIIM